MSDKETFNSSASEEDLYKYTLEDYTDLHKAAHTGNLKMLCKILREGKIDINEKTKTGKTALYVAILREQLPFVEKLLELGADPKIKVEGNTMLHTASSSPNVELLERIIQVLPNSINEKREEDGYTALHNAAIIGNPSCVQLLLDNGADPNIQDNNGRTPLHDAIQQELGDVIRLLLDRGADPNIVDKEGKTPKNLIETKVREGTLEESLLRIIERRERGLQQQQRISEVTSEVDSILESCPPICLII